MKRTKPMWVNTRIVLDMETGAVLEREGYEYRGPVALCDRSLQNQAQTNATNYGTSATGLSSYMTPLLESWAGGNAPGYGQGGVNQMTAAAQTEAGAASNQQQQQGLLHALRTGNAAGVGAEDVGAAVGAGQNQTQAVQNVLSRNAQLKAQQQTGAMNMLGSLYGTDVGAQTNNLNTAINAGNSGWFQNMLGFMNAAGSGMRGAGSMGASFGG